VERTCQHCQTVISTEANWRVVMIYGQGEVCERCRVTAHLFSRVRGMAPQREFGTVRTERWVGECVERLCVPMYGNPPMKLVFHYPRPNWKAMTGAGAPRFWTAAKPSKETKP